MNHLAMTALLLLTPACSISSIYPGAGAAVGGAVGGIGGPALGGAGALAGYSAGKAAQVAVAHKETLKALSEGDVSKLVKQGLVEAREDGFFDGMVNEFYGLMKLVCLGLILWNAVPLVWTYLLKKEVKKNGIAGKV